MFHGMKVPPERKFSLWTFRSQERKCWGTKSLDTVGNNASAVQHFNNKLDEVCKCALWKEIKLHIKHSN